MPSYSLANWDGHLSEQNQQSQDKPPTNTPLTFGSPIRLLKVSKPSHLQDDVQTNLYADGGLNHRVGTGGSGDGNSGVSSTAREHTLSPHLDKTSNVIARDMLYLVPVDKEFQIPIDSAKEGPKKDFQQYPESIYSADAEGESDWDEMAVDRTMEMSSWTSTGVFRDGPSVPRRETSPLISPLPQELESFSTLLSPPNSPYNDASSEFNESSLFTPPPQGRSARSLFTPLPSPAPGRSKSFSHVAVPGFPKGLTRKHYIPMTRKRGRPPRHVQVHQSIGEALQASLSHNADIGVPESIGRPAKVKRRHAPVNNMASLNRGASERFGKPPKKANLRDAITDSPANNMIVRKAKAINAIAGPSSASLPAVHVVRSQDRLGSVHQKRKLADDDDFVVPNLEGVSGRAAKRPIRTHVRRRDTSYKSDSDYLRIFIQQISPVPSAILTHNTRFIRTQTRNQTDDPNLHFYDTGVTKVDEYRGGSWFLWPRPKLGYHHQVQDDISLGGHWNIWEDEAEDRGKLHANQNAPRLLQKRKPAAQTSSSPGKSVAENPAVRFPSAPGKTPPRSTPGKPIHKPRQSSSSILETESESAENGFPNNVSPSDRSEGSPKPSAKAMGKRRAVSTPPEPQIEHQSPNLSRSSQSPPILESHLHGTPRLNNENEMAPYLHTLGPVHPQLVTHPMQTSPAFFQLLEHPLRSPNTLLSPSVSPSQSFDLEKQRFSSGANALSEQPSPPLLPGLRVSSEYEHGVINSWIMSNSSASNTPDPTIGYGNGTIDPSLLGGGIFAEDDPLVSPPPSPPPLSPHPYPSFGDSSHSPVHFPSPIAPLSPVASPSYSSYEPSQGSLPRSPSPRHSSTSDYSHDNPMSRLRRVFTRPRRLTRRIHPDMTAIDDLDLSTSSSNDESTSPKNKPSPIAKNQPQTSVKGGKANRRGESWPQEKLDTYCHQCRNKTFILKISCEDCSKKYCVRCLTMRYGEREASYDPVAEFVCPLCNDTCSCDICTRKRGGTYNRIKPLRPTGSQGPQTSPKAGKKTGQHRPRLGGKTNLPPKPTTISGPVTYWAAMYDLTGQKIGTAFVGGDGKDDVVMVHRGHVPRHRVFVGAVQPSWSLGGSPIIKDLEPVISTNPASSGKRLREYIGNRAILHFPIVPSAQADPADVEGSGTLVEGGAAPTVAVSNVEGASIYNADDEGVDEPFSSPLSSLSSLDDSCDEGGEGESRQWPFVHESDLGIAVQGGLDYFLEKGPRVGFSPDSLEDLDVVRAITLGLRACGVIVQI